MSYNLLEERWIPILWTDGKVSWVGIKEALAQAGRIRGIYSSSLSMSSPYIAFCLLCFIGKPIQKVESGRFEHLY